MARSNRKDVRRPEDWFPPANYNKPSLESMDAAIAAAIAAAFPIAESDVTGLVADLAAKLDDSQAGTFGLTLLGEATLAATKISLAYTKADIGLGSVDNTADAAKNVLTATKLLTARNINGVAFDGTADITINAVDATARVPATRAINTTAPITGGGDLSADRTIAISAASGAAAGSMSAADKTKLDAITGTNTGDQTTIVGITGTKAQFDTAVTDGNILYVGDITQYTDEMARDALGVALVAGANITITVNDAADTITIAASISGATLADADYGDIVVSSSGTVLTIDAGVVTLAKMANMATGSLIYRRTAGTGVPEVNMLATLKSDLLLTGTNSGDQTSIVGITGTKAQFNTACTDGDFLYVGDVTTFSDEAAQDAVGAMVDGTLTYVDATPLLQRAALSGDITAPAGSNVTTLAASGVTANTYGDSTHVAQVVVDAKGRVTSASSIAISGAGSVAVNLGLISMIATGQVIS